MFAVAGLFVGARAVACFFWGASFNEVATRIATTNMKNEAKRARFESPNIATLEVKDEMSSSP